MAKRIKIRKLVVVPHADILDERGEVIGEWTGSAFNVFAGSEHFPKKFALEIEDAVPKEKLVELERA